MRSADLLRTLDLFEELAPEDLEQLSHAAYEKLVPAGERVCGSNVSVTAGGADIPTDSMFVVVDGAIEVDRSETRDGSQPGSTMCLGNGDCWGETALISGERNPCTARAVVDTLLLVLDRDDFEAFVASRPTAMRQILAAVSRRAVQANQRLLTDESRPTSLPAMGRVYAVYSTRGGSGKTLLATRLALELSKRMPRRVALLDLDLLFDDATLELGVTPSRALGQLSETQAQRLDAQTMSELLTEQRDGLRVVVGAGRPEDGERVTPTHVRGVLTGLKRQFLATVIDCASTFSEPTLAALEMVDRVVVVCTPELATLRDVREMRRLFGQALHFERTRMLYVMNHPLPNIGLSRHQFEAALEQEMAFEVDYGGEAGSKPAFARAIGHLADELSAAAVERKRGFRPPWAGRIGARAKRLA